ncbi:hypothetical protein B0H11DRAFT_2316870 [Mycena galericulata]|nr:hypothetical protein B0H11DRAFT_2316870 [Mycena galericulata]
MNLNDDAQTKVIRLFSPDRTHHKHITKPMGPIRTDNRHDHRFHPYRRTSRHPRVNVDISAVHDGGGIAQLVLQFAPPASFNLDTHVVKKIKVFSSHCASIIVQRRAQAMIRENGFVGVFLWFLKLQSKRRRSVRFRPATTSIRSSVFFERPFPCSPHPIRSSSIQSIRSHSSTSDPPPRPPSTIRTASFAPAPASYPRRPPFSFPLLARPGVFPSVLFLGLPYYTTFLVLLLSATTTYVLVIVTVALHLYLLTRWEGKGALR